MAELENRVRRMEIIEEEARDVLKKNGQEDVEIIIMWKQQILNENRKQQIQK